MIRFLYQDQISNYPQLAETMFRHRALQFRERLGWDVKVDAQGYEFDDYDALSPLYVIWETAAGDHGGSMRLLPTTGRVMVNEHFSHLTGGVHIASPLIWECTRFCLAPDAAPQISAALMLAGSEVLQGFSLKHFVGVFDARMMRIYHRIGAVPDVIGKDDVTGISVGLWESCPKLYQKIAVKSGISIEISRHWFERAFGRCQESLRQPA